jgi:hypothetical protein
MVLSFTWFVLRCVTTGNLMKHMYTNNTGQRIRTGGYCLVYPALLPQGRRATMHKPSKRRVVQTITFIISMLVSGPVLAVSHTGRISVIQYNSQAEGRGVCVQTTPASPTGGGWICLWKDNPLYEVTDKFISDAYFNRKTCDFDWFRIRAGTPDLEIITCRG